MPVERSRIAVNAAFTFVVKMDDDSPNGVALLTAIASSSDFTRTKLTTTSANAAVAKKGSVAYDCSKAAANHLTRAMAMELAPLVRVNAVAPATVVQGSSMFPRDRVIGSLAKYNIAFTEDEATESLVS